MSKRAAEILAGKNVLSRPGYDALSAAARAKALTVAGVDAQDTLQKIRDALATNVEKGADRAAFRKAVLEAVGEGTFLSPAHLETVFRANVQSAFSDGQMQALQNPVVRGGFPYSAYDSIHDDRARPTHNSLDVSGIGGTNIYRNDDPVFQTFRPPWDYNCRCSWTPLTVRQAAERGVEEAKEWQKTGVPPASPAYVAMPPFRPSPGFQRAYAGAPMSIRLSMGSMTAYGVAAPPVTPPPRPALITADNYPRRSNGQFVDKLKIAAAARNSAAYQELRDDLPPEEHSKLDTLVAALHNGQTVHHPREAPGLGVNLDGNIPDFAWAYYAESRRMRDAWEERAAERAAARDRTDQFVKALRRGDPSIKLIRGLNNVSSLSTIAEIRTVVNGLLDSYEEELDKLEDLVENIGAPDADVRMIARVRRENMMAIEAAVEDYIASFKTNNDASLSTDAHGHQHKGKGPGGGQFVSQGQSDNTLRGNTQSSGGGRKKEWKPNNETTRPIMEGAHDLGDMLDVPRKWISMVFKGMRTIDDKKYDKRQERSAPYVASGLDTLVSEMEAHLNSGQPMSAQTKSDLQKVADVIEDHMYQLQPLTERVGFTKYLGKILGRFSKWLDTQ